MNSICFIWGSRCSIVFIISPKIYRSIYRSKVSRSHYSLSGKCPVDCYALYLVPLQKVTCEVQNTEGMKQMTWQLTCVTSCLGWLTPPSLHTASAQQRRVESTLSRCWWCPLLGSCLHMKHVVSSIVLILIVDPAAVFYLAAMQVLLLKPLEIWCLYFDAQINRQLRRWMIMMCPKCPGWVRRVCRGGAGQGLTMTGMVSAHSSQWRYDSHSDPRTVRHTTRQYHVQTLCE